MASIWGASRLGSSFIRIGFAIFREVGLFLGTEMVAISDFLPALTGPMRYAVPAFNQYTLPQYCYTPNITYYPTLPFEEVSFDFKPADI